MIPFLDLKLQHHALEPELAEAARRVIASGQFVLGEHNAVFEAAFAAFCGTRHAIFVGSGTAAIHLVLDALGIGPGDEVAMPAHTFIATAEPVSWLGARPRLIEIDDETGAMDPEALRAAIAGVKAVIPVHIHGRTVDLGAIGAICAEAGVPLIEDACQAHGAEYVSADGTVTRAGAYGIAGCFSFYPGKNLGAFGDAGAITTDDDALAAKLRLLRDHGRTTKYEHVVVGHAHRGDTIQAAVLGVKLTTLDADNQRRRDIAAAYGAALAGVGDLTFLAEPADRISVFHHFIVRTQHRESLLKHLNAAGVGAGVHYPIPLHLQPAYADLGHERGDFPVTEAFTDECLTLPIFAELTDDQVARVVAEVRDYFAAV